MLVAEGELCVCELGFVLDVSQPKISRHLATLRNIKLVTVRRQQVWMFYKLNSDLPVWITNILNETIAGLGENNFLANDLKKLKTMPARPEHCS